MYEELVNNLRICSRCDFGQNCNGCTQKSDDAFCCDKLLQEAANAIEEFNTHMRPVVRGKWEWTVADDEYFGEYWKCNLCGEHSYIGFNYCPNCGADMREER